MIYSRKYLDSKVETINELLGTPMKPYGYTKQGKFKANIGSYLLDSAEGGYALDQITNTSGGVRCIIYRNNPKQTNALLEAFISGIREVKQSNLCKK